jgi:hypothetical protein
MMSTISTYPRAAASLTALGARAADAKCRVEDTFEWGGKTLVATGRALALSALGETQYKVECLERI